MNFCFPYCFVNLCHLPEGRLNLSASVGKLDCDFYRESDFPNLERKSCGHTFKTLVGFFLLPFKRFRFLFCDSVSQNRNTNIRIYLELTKKNQDYFRLFSEKSINNISLQYDLRLHQEWGPYEERGQSMNDCILEHYGHDAVALIEKMI